MFQVENGSKERVTWITEPVAIEGIIGMDYEIYG